MELSVLERLLLWQELAGFRGSYRQVRAAAKLRLELLPLPEEREAIGWVDDENGVHWDGTLAADVHYGLDEDTRAAIVTALRRADEDGKLTEQHITLCEKFGIE